MDPSCAAMTLGEKLRNSEKLPLNKWFCSQAKGTWFSRMTYGMVDFPDPRETRLLLVRWLYELRGWSMIWGCFVKIWCTLEELLSWFLVDSLPNACKSLQTHTKDFLTLEKYVSMFRVCAVWVLLRLYCLEVTFRLSWGQCFLFVSDLSGKKCTKIKQKYAVC